jgi:hypothetical protein
MMSKAVHHTSRENPLQRRLQDQVTRKRPQMVRPLSLRLRPPQRAPPLLLPLKIHLGPGPIQRTRQHPTPDERDRAAREVRRMVAAAATAGPLAPRKASWGLSGTESRASWDGGSKIDETLSF